jgi:hypothetical protein
MFRIITVQAKRIMNWLLDFSSDHPRIMAVICLTLPLALLGLGRIFEGTIIPKLLAVLIIAPFAILIIAELCGAFDKK